MKYLNYTRICNWWEYFAIISCHVLLGKKSILAGKKLNDIATISDKAFVLLILENIWHDMMEVSINEYYWPKKKKTTDERSS